MASCDRCGRDEADGATLEQDLEREAVLCIVCRDYLNEATVGRRADQASLEDYS